MQVHVVLHFSHHVSSPFFHCFSPIQSNN